ncbi:MAG: hypothetical protein WC674_04700 [Candidatus Krumholzibacteriia bacterium]
MKKLVALVFAVLILAPSLARAIDVFVQAEDFTSSNNIMPENIRAYNSALLGLDYEGEWAEFQVPASGFGTYLLSMRCWGNLNSPYLFHLVTKPVQGEDPQTITLSFAGKGYCGS